MTTNKIKRILVINGHPDPDSYNQALAQSYLKELETHLSIQIRYLALHTLEFNPNLEYGYRKRTELEPDLLLALEDIKWADHMVWIHPLWWLGLPALMKGFFDRAFLPGITFVHHSSDNTEVLLLGKTARIITTGGDLNKEIYNDVYKQSGLIQLKEGILEYCGVHVTDTTFIGPMNDLTANDRLWWLNEVKNYAIKDSQH
ncbi:NAD(P)H-dependent oxidoreductase [Myroides marinus]|uniref:NAD(P)H-dependent oxidoreductase n=1 Tax=Myroides marinus TaxID=703342 RepID=UPI0025786014|nr:NAD(P)H-dependent oxidoreductase [Myroides marinus]MDM1377525.1 NAD(P)H-dependent oxidoreductase [Myroides marinus]MDM1384795.1 NAD(P)H-dependent oxidoreductase [Myroides marinus]MDM1388813.1 NAD(P)H-dependent oxidoreductase [Myroides marinus]MDM1392009.1 NAD(P)H-dependent oxidoreductase [Myroides marinus]